MQEVKFSVNPHLAIFENGFSDAEVAEIAEQTKERLGYFERWGEKVVYHGDQAFQSTVGVIVEAATGKVFEVEPQNITFPKDNAVSF